MQLEKGDGGEGSHQPRVTYVCTYVFPPTFHWPELVTWFHPDAEAGGKCNSLAGQPLSYTSTLS